MPVGVCKDGLETGFCLKRNQHDGVGNVICYYKIGTGTGGSVRTVSLLGLADGFTDIPEAELSIDRYKGNVGFGFD